jgi:hypothetical protein
MVEATMKNLLWMSVLILCTTSSMAKHLPTSKSSLAPSHESLLRQNWAIDQMGLARIQNECELSKMVAQGLLSPLPTNKALRVSPSLPQERRYVTPFVVPFLLSLSEQFYNRFDKALVIDSAVRDVHTQKLLRKRNASAAPAEGDTASSHESGHTVDLSKRMTRAQLQWLRNVLSMYQAYSVVIVEEERHCIHIEIIGDIQ